MLPPEVEAAAQRALAALGAQSVFTYLANRLERHADAGSKDATTAIPYSTIAAIDMSADFQLKSADGQDIANPGPDEIVLTDWAADDLGVAAGDSIRLTYFEPETTHGASVEKQHLLKVAAITPLTEPAAPYLPLCKLQFAQRPTAANDPGLTPEVKGITDQKSLDDWEVPFTIDYQLIREGRHVLGGLRHDTQSLRVAGDRMPFVGKPLWQGHLVSHSGPQRSHPGSDRTSIARTAGRRQCRSRIQFPVDQGPTTGRLGR